MVRTSAVDTLASRQINKIDLGAFRCCSVVGASDKLIEGDGDNGMRTTACFIHISRSNSPIFGSMIHERRHLGGVGQEHARW